jgi:hypothetical protein
LGRLSSPLSPALSPEGEREINKIHPARLPPANLEDQRFFQHQRAVAGEGLHISSLP